MIKKIHYCWFGGKPLSKLTQKCIESWKKYLPDFEIIEWNENNFDVNQCNFVKQAYEQKKWAYVADYTRLKVLEKFGGLYLDTDMEITNNIDKYLENDLFVGKEDSKMANAAVIWVKNKNNKHIKEMIDIYESFEKFNDTGNIYNISIPRILTDYLKKYNFDMENEDIQILDNGTVYVYPMEYFYPLSYDHQNNNFTKNSCMIHHFDATWTSKYEKASLFCRRHNLRVLLKIINFLSLIKIKLKNMLENKNTLIYFLLITVAFFGIFIKLEFATDTYAIFYDDYINPFHHFMKSGRFITAFFWYIVSILGLSINTSYTISYIIAFICIVFSQYKLYNILKSKINNDNVNKIISTLIIINAFSIELFLFYEKGILSLSILFIITAIQYIIKAFEGKKKYLVHSFVAMILANFCYQGTVGLFVALSLIFIVYYYKNIKQFFINNIYVGLIYGLSAFVNFFFVNFVYNNTRTSDGGSIMEKIDKIQDNFNILFINTFGILPKYGYICIICILFIIFLVNIIIRKDKASRKTGLILGIFYIILGTILVSLAPQIMVNVKYIGLAPRSTYAIGALPGLVLLYMYINMNIQKKQNKYIYLFCLIYLVIQFSSFIRISLDHYTLNYIDKYISTQIAEQIYEYQDRTGNIIKKISIYKDKNPRSTYQYLFSSGDINVSGYSTVWSIKETLYMSTGIRLSETENDSNIYEENFKDKDWSYFDKSQVVLIGDTLNLCIF